MKFKDIVWIDRYYSVPPFLLALFMLFLGSWLQVIRPEWGTGPLQMLGWGFFVSTALVYHVTFCINSVTHIFGGRRYATKDQSRNCFWLAILTMGEGWHNNHHRYPLSARQGFYWWEVDITYYILKLLSFVGLVSDLKPPPARVYEKDAQIDSGALPPSKPVV